MENTTVKDEELKFSKKKKVGFKNIIEQKYLIFMSLPFVIWAIIFKYLPLWGWTMAFQDFKPAKTFAEQTWVGFKHFKTFIIDPEFPKLMRNTLGMSLLGIIFGFTVPIIFALLLNELRGNKFKRTVQSVSYLPHFVSWVVTASIVTTLLAAPGGPVNQLLMNMHIISEPIQFLAKPKLFWGIVTISDVWKETGWNAIIYLAAMTGIDPELYDAAKVDGAGRFRRMWNITLPSIKPTIMVLLIMSIGSLINIGFEKQFLLKTPMVMDYANVLDLYALNYGIGMFRYSYGTAIGIFKSVVSIILIFLANKASEKWGEGKIL